MLFQSFDFILFFIFFCTVYWVVPHKYRYIIMLIGNGWFYMQANPLNVILLLFSIITVYWGALQIEKIENTSPDNNSKNKKKNLLFTVIFLNVGLLIFYKYVNFISSEFSSLSDIIGLNIHIPAMSIMLPVGISFYTMTVIGYIVDVYRGTQKAEKHFGYFAVFVSFFPQLLAGPIAKSSRMLPQYREIKKLSMENIEAGLLMIVLGLFKKIVIADRLALFVNAIFNNPEQYARPMIIFGIALYSIQLYCDFSAYSEIAMGISKLLGINIIRNFNKPMLADNIAGFYRNWHISLTNWLNEYIFVPLSRGKKRKWEIYRSIMVVWFISGLWHGANFTFILWGILNGVFNIIGKETRAIRNKICNYIKFQGIFRKIIAVMTTFCLVAFSRLFFRAESIGDACTLLMNIIIPPPHTLPYLWLPQNAGIKELAIALFSLVCLFTLEIASLKKDLYSHFFRVSAFFKYASYYFIILFILIFGAYGSGYETTNFIYFRF